ncbi:MULTISPECIES: amidohydrolase [Jonquetella]|uniref:Peptidase M20 domain-containing protein 2 n=1 Tax=Jonquetella anthropi DSM 22815 TaxID=885272 RepID=H0UIR1_9BACT|nr:MULTISPECIES: amidohydrolase [Jonquetella]EEX49357.1 amidohydrolase [Jonquetella anthropi E3_33 E1]EHM13806.1 amidohydrolase [Jonquetella anthropi DSM 22815]ERL24279.1 amidohydrolase [Jonquetella sp. BV3C21]
MTGTKKELKAMVVSSIDRRAEESQQLASSIAETPELGYFEFQTSEKIKKALEALGLKVENGLARTGLKAVLQCSTDGPTVAVIGELDGIPCVAHPTADPKTGASHACGHNLQVTEMVAVAAALSDPAVRGKLSGRVAFMAVPAEEFIEIDRRTALREEGAIAYLGGKQELVRLGVFDDVDMAMMVHAGGHAPEPGFDVPDLSMGFRAFSIRYKGKASHAAGAPHEGINALNAAIIGIGAVNALRETFRDEDNVRVHFIITKGGTSVNSVPDDVRLEGYVRALSTDCINRTFDRVIDAFESGAKAVGASFSASSLPGYLPLKCSVRLNDLFSSNAEGLVGADRVKRHTVFSASTDLGDLTQIMPAIQPLAGGTDGALHAPEFGVVDFNSAVLAPAKAMAMTVIDLLADGAAEAKDLLANFTPVFSKSGYLANLDASFGVRSSGPESR